MINRDESKLIAREQRNLRGESARPTEPKRWQHTQAANDADSRIEFRTLTANRTTRYTDKRPG
ncbi:MAG: hypothetical protein AB8B93_18860 [Pseudomonadales bacterium]